MSIIVKPHGDFAPNTTAESAKVNDQINTLYTDHNGGLLDANIAAVANIQQSKIFSLTSDLAAITTNVNTLFADFNVALSTVANDVGEPSSAVVGEAQLYQPILVAANSLGVDNYLMLSQDFLFNIITGATCQLRYYYGGIAIFAPIITNSTGVNQANVVAHVDITLRARAAVNLQYAIGRIFLQTFSTNLYVAGVGQNQFLNSVGIAADSTVDQYLQTNVVWDQPDNIIFGVGCSSWIVK